MIEKYYTPTIEEFHVGFKFELAYSFTKNGVRQEDLLVEHTIEVNSDLELIQAQIKENLIRVKYLDRKDIESLGFVKTDTILTASTNLFAKKLNDNITCLIHVYWNLSLIDRECLIRIRVGNNNNIAYNEVFVGEIKNKSELSRLLKQLEIK